MDLPIHFPIRSPRFVALLVLVTAPAALWAQTPPPPPPPPPAGGAADNFGQPLAGLTNGQLADFLDGQADFAKAETAATGLGPIFNDVSCVACHRAAAPGGAGGRTVTRFGHTAGAVFDPMTALGGSLLQERALTPQLREKLPQGANTVALRLTTPLFGAGLIEAIDDATIKAYAQKQQAAGGKGRAALVRDVSTGLTRVGRFGWKAQHATLLGFAADAYNNEMGITNRFFPSENAPNGNVALIAAYIKTAVDDLPDPATGRGDIDRVTLYMRYLAAPARSPVNAAAAAGEKVFATANCISCHNPSYPTAKNSVAALSEKTVPLYSDLLLHDMGALGDGIAQENAGVREMRTAPLWGLRKRPAYLHDGRATTVEAAIKAHDGEGAAARDAYNKLSSAAQQQLLAFLNTL